MCTPISRCFLLATAVLAITFAQGLRGQPAMAQTQTSSSSEPWLDQAVAQGHCPLTAVNLPPGFQPNVQALQKRVKIVDDTLQIKGTRNPDHILLRSGGASGVVRVRFDGIYLGAFGPVARILVQGRGGADVIIVGRRIGLPAQLEGGPGDDCLQSGSGGDQLINEGGNDVLIAGTGRPALKTVSGSSRIVVRRRMGTLRIVASAKSRLLPLLNSLYRLRSLTQDLGSASKPIILTPAALAETGIVPLLQRAYAAGQSIVLLHTTTAQAARLGALLGQPNAAEGIKRGRTAALVYFRKSPRPGSTAFDYRTGFVTRSALLGLLSGPKEPIIELLSQIFSATAIPASPLAASGDPPIDIANLADAYITNTTVSRNGVIQITNTIWDVRSFTNNLDLYLVQQEDVFTFPSKAYLDPIDLAFAYNRITNIGVKPTITQSTPETTKCDIDTTQGVNFNLGGSAGWTQEKGLNATVTSGLTLVDTKTTHCPSITITNQNDLPNGIANWRYDIPPSTCSVYPCNRTFNNIWIWMVNYKGSTPAYAAGQETIRIASDVFKCAPDIICQPDFAADVDAVLNSDIPLPFDQTFTLENPHVLSVSSQDNPGSTCVNVGKNFYINGTGFYPSLVTSVLINGTPVATFSAISDTSVQVTAPSQVSRTAQPVVVQTELGLSNSNIAITISSSCPAPS